MLETCCAILDTKDVSLTSAPLIMGYLSRVSGISQNYYPKRLGKLYIINVPWSFSTVFSVIKGFLDPVMVAKISVLGSDYKIELLAQIHAQNLPKFLGGACDCQGGCVFSDLGPWRNPEHCKPAKWGLERQQEHGIERSTTSSGVPEESGESGEAAPAGGQTQGEVGDKVKPETHPAT